MTEAKRLSDMYRLVGDDATAALRWQVQENARLVAENAQLRDRVAELEDEFDGRDDDDDIDPEVEESATVAELKDLVDGLQKRLDAERLAHSQLREQHRLMDADYRQKAAELHEMRDPNKREGRERELLVQLGQMQTELFDWQAKYRAEKSSHERTSLLSPELRQRQVERAELLEGVRKHTEAAEGYRLEAHKLALQPSGALAAEAKPRDYYERMLEEVSSSKATTVAGLKKKVISMLSDALDELREDDL